MAQKGIEDANDILAPTDNKRDLKARARLVYGNRCEASQATLGSLQPPLPPNLGRPAASLSPPPTLSRSFSLSTIEGMHASLAGLSARVACLPRHHPCTTHTSPPAPSPSQGNDPDAGGPPKFPWQK